MMRNRLWNELAQAKFNEIYAAKLISWKRRIINWYNILVIIFSSSGILNWKIFNINYSSIVCAIIAIMALVHRLKSNIIPSQIELTKLDKLVDFYSDYYLKLERLWYDSENVIISKDKMIEELHKLEQTERKINKLVNEVIVTDNSVVIRSSKKAAKLFFNSSFNIAI